MSCHQDSLIQVVAGLEDQQWPHLHAECLSAKLLAGPPPSACPLFPEGQPGLLYQEPHW